MNGNPNQSQRIKNSIFRITTLCINVIIRIRPPNWFKWPHNAYSTSRTAQHKKGFYFLLAHKLILYCANMLQIIRLSSTIRTDRLGVEFFWKFCLFYFRKFIQDVCKKTVNLVRKNSLRNVSLDIIHKVKESELSKNTQINKDTN